MKTIAVPDLDVWIVIPAFNEGRVIRETVSGLRSLYPKVSIAVVDDGSTDDTPARLAGLDVWYLRHDNNLGQGAALNTGIQFALQHGARAIFTFDADGQHPPQAVTEMLSKLRADKCDVVLASRFLNTSHSKEVPIARAWLLRIATRFTRHLIGLDVTDTHNGLRCFSGRAARRLHLRSHGMAHATEILIQIRKHGLSFTEVPVRTTYTTYSLRKGQSLAQSVPLLGDLLLARGRIARLTPPPEHPIYVERRGHAIARAARI